ncbi:hypothetical protein QYG89_14815 [Bacillus sp. B190/17]|uniref:Uncharacterized protein n=1 Tax=Bacillus lumedeiriae TaxID=3058829 RepID=A0ABW8IE07_9BACI
MWEQLTADGVTRAVIDRFTGLLLVNEIHSCDEEPLLFGEG